MSYEEQSRSSTQFVIGNQKHEFVFSLEVISIGKAAFSKFMIKVFRPVILSENFTICLDCVFIQSETKHEVFKVSDKNHLLLNENKKANWLKSILGTKKTKNKTFQVKA